MRELARLALSDDWTMAKGIEVLGAEDPDVAISAYEDGLVPLMEAESLERGRNGEFGPGMTALRTWLRPIAMKIAPTMETELSSDWLTAVAMALSDFPAKIAVQAARAALHIPMNYLNEVDGHVRVEAERLMERHRNALWRLRQMREEIERAARPPVPQLEAVEDVQPWTLEQARGTPAYLLDVGLRAGFISREIHDQVIAERQAVQGIEIFARILGSIAEAERIAAEAQPEPAGAT